MELKEGMSVRFRGLGPRSIKSKGKVVAVYKNFILLDAGNYMITINRADVIDKEVIVEAKINKIWTTVTSEVFQSVHK